ncbi:MAG: phosphatase PAP2 family protein [Lachnospiraceae bacterium]|jgi:undecaprenyl-diphosphatase
MTNILLGGATLGAWLDTFFAGFDYAVLQFFGGLHSDFLTLLAKIVTSLGSTIYIVLFAMMGLVMCFFRRTRKLGFGIIFAALIGLLVVNIFLKPFALRVRPYNTLQDDAAYWSWYVSAGMLSESDYCFPSGHTSSATEIAVVLFLCHITSKRKAARGWAIIFPIGAILVGASRIYLMIHYPSDVLGGFITGIFAGVLGYLLACLVVKLFKRDSSAEAQNALKKPLRIGAVIMIFLAWIIMFSVSFAMLQKTGGEDAVRCAYDGDYNCQNEAKVDDEKYPAIDGKYYCKIHWRELND